MVVAKRFSPLSSHRFRFVYDKLALPDHFPTACNIAQSHELSSLFFIIILLGFCLSPTYEQAHVGSDLLTLALIPTDCSVLRTPTILISIYLTIFRDKKEALRFGNATRAIRKIASSTLSAASQLIFAHNAALPS